MSTLTPIQTRYAGCHFRSRLEARWAVFLDTLNVTWEYEPEGFQLPSGHYLPDFWLPGIGWLEIKPTETDSDPRWGELAEASDSPVFVARGLPTVTEVSDNGSVDRIDMYGPESGTGDRHYRFCVCPTCGKVGIEYDGRGARVCGHPGHNDKSYTYDDPRVVNAYTKARSARFEHGARP